MSRAPTPKPSPAFAGSALVLPFAAAFALAGAYWLAPAPPDPVPLAIFWLTATVAALHRPVDDERGLALGAMALPLTATELGLAAVGIVALAAWSVATVIRVRFLGGRSPGLVGGAQLAATVTLAALGAAAAGLFWPFADPAAAGVVATGVYLAALLLADALQTWWTTGSLGRAALRLLREPFGLAAEAFGYGSGAVLAAVHADTGRRPAYLLLALFALLAAEAARQRLLRRRAEARDQAMERLGDAGRRLARATTPASILPDEVCRECRQVVSFSWFHLELLAGDGGPTSWRAGDDGNVRPGTPQPPERPPAMPGIHRRGEWKILERELAAGGEHLATVRLWLDSRTVQDEEIRLFDRLVTQLSTLVHRSVLDSQARRDTLTGAALRRVLDRRLEESFESACELGGSLAMVLVDLDHFKAINDTHGHAGGDLVLVEVAKVLDGHLRDGDVCARWGGEEFALLFEGLDGLAALRIADRLRQEVEALELLHEGTRLTPTLSAGVAAFPEVHCREATEIIELADEALYESKRTGRNRCLLHRGRHRFVDPDGRSRGGGDSGPVEAPKFF